MGDASILRFQSRTHQALVIVPLRNYMEMSMASQLDRLVKLMPPLSPRPGNVVDWKLAEDVFGVTFPTDYKQFIDLYGNVIWCDAFRPFYPNTSSRAECENSKQHYLDVLSKMYKFDIITGDGVRVDIPPYPTRGGLLPCLADTDGGWVCWHMKGNPEKWTMTLYNGGTMWFFPMSLTKMIADWIEQVPPADAVWHSEHLEPDEYGITP